MNVAMVEAMIVLATAIQAFSFERVSDAEPTLATGVTLRPRDGIQARIRRRTADVGQRELMQRHAPAGCPMHVS